ncbi:hypothetical protein A2533_05100 [Candidatus Falkowbacteria bacterium RIFOXYD2_FULL_35_9]|uniref:Peptidase M20 dimerisation domain-containing protein n=1 Tax=Candidatus Falkowbacteria bacterium RIFOXYC2_FULL_36_12 TaxID=1798002 RepID=A0A1F5T0S7_9BACT|nr:MAG: hypothetical protein A2300_03470 [Candidatus Falkowbacteria bacterium RIFOXYB2_FULL_35_7]OGF32353.1 MAG: hypothetical protein A2478_03465 [Candidatus Falkowbacteria bacterium RIFOXYC2_FULL_36_12]OGF33248.1 MAG: hypothetical protein A2223_03945 [Candidatus Falkowbacteria bacterium RIFOXYA2_FULL_35_8]OGF46467.1 MAG: hypothetical protein A2533_05100 [Candidatus Falkowbacteria bacterium RIFOXYD2_FULL_35_9]
MKSEELIRKLVSFDTQCIKSNKEIVKYISSLFPPEIVEIIPIKKNKIIVYNLILSFKGKSNNSPIIFSGHTDTIPLSGEWTKDPFKGEVINGNIFGLGAVDMKGGLVAMILTALKLVGTTPENDVYFLFDADEECNCVGGKYFADNFNPENNKCRIVIGEPTDGKLEIGQKGVIEFRVTYRGKSIHASKATREKNKNFNAISKVYSALQLIDIEEQRLAKMIDKNFGSPTIAICQINGGSAANVIPDSCSFVFSRRLLPSEDIEKVKEKLRNMFVSVDSRVQIEELLIGDSNLLSENDNLYMQASEICNNLLGKCEKDISAGWTQAGYYKKWGECLIWGPGNKGQAHSVDEFIELAQIDKMAGCYFALTKI